MAPTPAKRINQADASELSELAGDDFARQVSTAKKYPRDEAAALDQVLALATRSDAVAELCMYTLKRTDKDGKQVFITGPSIRFAELLNYCWGNMRVGARISEETDKYVVAQGVAYDLQRNNGMLVGTRRGIVTNSGGRFGSDMINVTSNAACAIAQRNAIIDCIPIVLWEDVWEQVKAKAVGAAQIPERIQNAVKFFITQGAKIEDILTALAVKTVAEMGREHLEIFIGLKTALKDGGITADKIFTAEGAEQRARLNLIAAGDDPAHPDVRGTPIDGLLDKGKRAEPAPTPEPADKKKGGASAKKAAQKAKGEETPEPADGDQANAGATDAGSGAADADDVDKADADLVATLEAKLDPAKAMSSRKAVDEHRGALARIAELGSDALKTRAAKILQDWPAK